MHAHINVHFKEVEVTSLTYHGVVFSFCFGIVKTSFKYIAYCLDQIVSVTVNHNVKISVLFERNRKRKKDKDRKQGWLTRPCDFTLLVYSILCVFSIYLFLFNIGYIAHDYITLFFYSCALFWFTIVIELSKKDISEVMNVSANVILRWCR